MRSLKVERRLLRMAMLRPSNTGHTGNIFVQLVVQQMFRCELRLFVALSASSACSTNVDVAKSRSDFYNMKIFCSRRLDKISARTFET